jgi:hypothetical protein
MLTFILMFASWYNIIFVIKLLGFICMCIGGKTFYHHKFQLYALGSNSCGSLLLHPKIMIVQWTIFTHFHSNVCNHRMVYLVANEGEFNMNPPSTFPHACDLNSILSTPWWDCSSMHSLQIVKTITNVQNHSSYSTYLCPYHIGKRPTFCTLICIF